MNKEGKKLTKMNPLIKQQEDEVNFTKQVLRESTDKKLSQKNLFIKKENVNNLTLRTNIR